MTFLNLVPDGEAEGLVKEIYDGDRAPDGHIPEHSRVMAVNPEAEQAWEGLIRAITAQMDKRRYELVTLAAARALGSRHCRLAHGARSLRWIEHDELVALAADHRDAGLSEAEVAMMDFAEKLSTDAASMTEEDGLRLRAVGFTDREIVDIALTAAARNYYSRTIQALGVAVDVPDGLDAPLTEALLRGI
jgi:uncharacterized peroxidase-related enzyme